MLNKWGKHISLFLVALLLAFSGNSQNNNLSNLSVVIEFKTAPTSVNIIHTPLKYNKDFALSFTMDDGPKDIYTHAFKLLNGGTIEGVNYNPLYYTDGCGNDIKFSMSAAIFSLSAYNNKDVHEPGTDFATLYITWPEIIEMYQNGCGILNHGLTTSTSGDLKYLVGRNHSYIKYKTQEATPGGIHSTVFVNPNGAEEFNVPAFEQGYNVAYRLISYGVDYLNVFTTSSILNLDNLEIGRKEITSSTDLALLADQLYSASNTIPNTTPWVSTFCHSVTGNYGGFSFTVFKNYIQDIAATYGKEGLDNIWFTTEEEVLDYVLVRDAITVNQQTIDNKIHLTFTGDTPSNLRNYALSLSVFSNATDTITGVSINGDTYSSYSTLNKREILINTEWDGINLPSALEIATLYVDSTESTNSQSVANIAMDYVNIMEAGPEKDNLQSRLCGIDGVSMPEDFCTTCSTFIGNDITICEDDCIELSVPDATSYIWSTGETTQNIIICPTITTEYSVKSFNDVGCEARDTIIVAVIPTLETQTSNDTIVCPKQCIKIWASGGSRYLWDSGETTDTIKVCPNVATKYYVSVFNSLGCTTVDSVFVDVYPAPNANAGEDISICPENCTTLTATGGYVYNWNTGAETNSIEVCPDVTTQYYVTVYNEYECPATDSVLVSLRTLPTIDAGNDTTKCISDCINLKATGGLTYLWSNGDNSQISKVCPSIETKYYVTGTDEFGCSAIDSLTVNINAYPDVNLLGILPAYCEDASSILLEGSPEDGTFGGNGVSGNIFSPSAAGVGVHPIYYSIVDNGCAVGDTINVHIYETPDFSLGDDVTLCTNETLEIFVPVGYDQYLWSNGNTSNNYLFVDINKFGLGTTIVELTATDNGCVAKDEIAITFESCNVGIEDLEEIGIRIYPNPSSGIFNITYDGIEMDSYFGIYNMQGQEVYSERLNECHENQCHKSLDVSFLNKGIYLIRFYNKKGVRTGKLFLQ